MEWQRICTGIEVHLSAVIHLQYGTFWAPCFCDS